MLGLKRGTVALMPHERAWEDAARQVIDRLWQVLGHAARDIQHVGSTAITHISAKPIVDIAVGMDNPEQVLAFCDALEEQGIIFRNHGKDDEGGLLFVTGDFVADTRTSHLHVVVWQGEAWYNYINFRDYLNGVPEAAHRYEAEKRRLAALYPHDRVRYTDGKAPIITELLAEAAAWRRGKEEGQCE